MRVWNSQRRGAMKNLLSFVLVVLSVSHSVWGSTRDIESLLRVDLHSLDIPDTVLKTGVVLENKSSFLNATSIHSKRRWQELVSASSSSSQGRPINIALHSQSKYVEHGWVAGSEITTRGLKKALESDSGVNKVEVFAPFSYKGLIDVQWDLVIIEGWTATVPAFLRRIRESNSEVVVLHYCLDTYPSMETVLSLDVDGYLTNSMQLLPHLSSLLPAAYVPLAADPDEMGKVPVEERYAHPVVYLGQVSTGKYQLMQMLEQVADLGLAIYGNGWQNVDHPLRTHWRGILPAGDIQALYSSARVVLGTTETKQRVLGMVNNRVFEALSCGAAFVSDGFPQVKETFGDAALYFNSYEDVRGIVSSLLSNETLRAELGRKGRELIVERHTYKHRVETILRHFDKIRMDSERKDRRNRPSISILHSSNNTAFLQDEAERSFVRSLGLLSSFYRITTTDIYKPSESLLPSKSSKASQGEATTTPANHTLDQSEVENLLQALCESETLLILSFSLPPSWTQTILKLREDDLCAAKIGILRETSTHPDCLTTTGKERQQEKRVKQGDLPLDLSGSLLEDSPDVSIQRLADCVIAFHGEPAPENSQSLHMEGPFGATLSISWRSFVSPTSFDFHSLRETVRTIRRASTDAENVGGAVADQLQETVNLEDLEIDMTVVSLQNSIPEARIAQKQSERAHNLCPGLQGRSSNREGPKACVILALRGDKDGKIRLMRLEQHFLTKGQETFIIHVSRLLDIVSVFAKSKTVYFTEDSADRALSTYSSTIMLAALASGANVEIAGDNSMLENVFRQVLENEVWWKQTMKEIENETIEFYGRGRASRDGQNDKEGISEGKNDLHKDSNSGEKHKKRKKRSDSNDNNSGDNNNSGFSLNSDRDTKGGYSRLWRRLMKSYRDNVIDRNPAGETRSLKKLWPWSDQYRSLLLKGFIEKVLQLPKRSASVHLSPTMPREIISPGPIAQLRLKVEVSIHNFRVPADGCWCMKVNGIVYGCQGDDLSFLSFEMERYLRLFSDLSLPLPSWYTSRGIGEAQQQQQQQQVHKQQQQEQRHTAYIEDGQDEGAEGQEPQEEREEEQEDQEPEQSQDNRDFHPQDGGDHRQHKVQEQHTLMNASRNNQTLSRNVVDKPQTAVMPNMRLKTRTSASANPNRAPLLLSFFLRTGLEEEIIVYESQSEQIDIVLAD